MTDKMRQEFEAAINKNQVDGGFGPANLERCGLDDRYVLVEVAGAWWGWQASRAALVVELPAGIETLVGPVLKRFEAVAAIEDAGLTVKP